MRYGEHEARDLSDPRMRGALSRTVFGNGRRQTLIFSLEGPADKGGEKLPRA